MEIFFNELSNKPFAIDDSSAKQKIISLLETLKRLRKDGFNVMRAPENFFSQQLSANYTFISFFNDPTVSKDLKILLRGIVKSPYIENEYSYEVEIFILTEFSVKDENGIDLSPEGLASAWLFNSPLISLMGNTHWERELIPLNIINQGNRIQEITKNIINVYSIESVEREYFRKWLQFLSDEIQLNSLENIAKIFPSDKFLFEQRAIDDLISWHNDDIRFITRIKDLINDIVQNPYTGGIGHTEVLKGKGGKASKRIIKKDRLIYTYNQNQIIIHQCRGHYDD